MKCPAIATFKVRIPTSKPQIPNTYRPKSGEQPTYINQMAGLTIIESQIPDPRSQKVLWPRRCATRVQNVRPAERQIPAAWGGFLNMATADQAALWRHRLLPSSWVRCFIMVDGRIVAVSLWMWRWRWVGGGGGEDDDDEAKACVYEYHVPPTSSNVGRYPT
ncbi:hypothetical protein K402DRAFT_248232 [Aulographum hederae CBS 113979]|uniref:Uncharacterized protein n=1 Tax=Aulographum hederae CBS 113979 TaxID=1176131 RepID=A0A6G1HAM9_9PEZI|nr:hypothetical protein K402DRAFT_248232 [Aulographum hederae CBS 113979]